MRDVSSSFGRFHSIFYRHTSPLPSLVGNIPIAREGLMGKRLYIHHIAIYRKYYGDTIDGTLSKMQIEAVSFPLFYQFLMCLNNVICNVAKPPKHSGGCSTVTSPCERSIAFTSFSLCFQLLFNSSKLS